MLLRNDNIQCPKCKTFVFEEVQHMRLLRDGIKSKQQLPAGNKMPDTFKRNETWVYRCVHCGKILTESELTAQI